MNFFVIYCIESLLYPPGGSILLLLTGLLLHQRWHQVSLTLISLALLTLYFSSIPFTNQLLAHWLEPDSPLTFSKVKTADAIVVLAFKAYNSPEYGQITSGPDEISRLRYAAYLHRKTGLPIAVIGGDRLNIGNTGAERMTKVLEHECNVPVRYKDGRSLHTFDNAKYAHEILSKDGINRIALVTHAWHMPRSKRSFENEGFSVIAAPTQFLIPGPFQKGIGKWIPRAECIEHNHWFFHELAGMLWFKMFQ
ncbi:YdcF family protein [Candidatus Electrothrix sp.]|uniref:YdcF family protein n=1 Tax=Candidatus Electrothrix sp. TaxID=2170559 RepID=UPI00405709B5